MAQTGFLMMWLIYFHVMIVYFDLFIVHMCNICSLLFYCIYESENDHSACSLAFAVTVMGQQIIYQSQTVLR